MNRLAFAEVAPIQLKYNFFKPNFFTCHLSLTPTDTATETPSTKSPTMHSMLVCKDLKIQEIEIQNTKNYLNAKNV